MKARNWIIGWLIFVIVALLAIGYLVIKIDPYFHYHKPDLTNFFYSLDNQRSQNDGIIKHFEYNALITGTSMVENFKTSEMDEVFGVNSIKVPFMGALYKEINDNLIVALENNHNLKTIIRGLDYYSILQYKDGTREDLGTYPTYLYDYNPFNDVQYLFNKDVIFNRAYSMYQQSKNEGFVPGITSFDEYSHWQHHYTFGANTVLQSSISSSAPSISAHLTDEERIIIHDNITQNVTSLADEYPYVDFYYFFTPYSVAYWSDLNNSGTLKKQIESEEYAIKLILEHPNIHLFSFNNRTDITSDLNNYKDTVHYGQWVNSLILRWMKDDEYLLSKDNYQEYLDEELKYYTSFDYSGLNNQNDYESDLYAAALLNKEIKGVEPLNVLEDETCNVELSNAAIVENQYNRKLGIQCSGSLSKDEKVETNIEEYDSQHDFTGAKIEINDVDEHDYLVFYAKTSIGNGPLAVSIYNEFNEKIAEISANNNAQDNEWHQYVVDISNAECGIYIVFNCVYLKNAMNAEPNYIISGITLY